MLDIAEGCFVKMAELLLVSGRSVRQVFSKFSAPEIFPDRTVMELLSPLSFLEGIKDLGLDDLQEIEAACLMRVLAKPELENAIILNELALIMENFGVPDGDDDAEDDYIPDTETESVSAHEEKKDVKPRSRKRVYDLKRIDQKGIKILRKLARFLLKQFLHPREFFGKAIYKEKIKTKKRDFLLDVMKVKDFYLRMKIASIRKRLTENTSINDELCVDLKTHKELINVKQMVRALEEIAEEEQLLMMKDEAAALTPDQQKSAKIESEAASSEAVSTPTLNDKEKKPLEGKVEGGKPKKKSDVQDYYSAGPSSEVIRFGIGKGESKRMGAQIHLNTIEEEKHETQTSNYFEGMSEKDDSRMMGSNNLRYSNNTKEFEFEEETKRSAHKMTSDIFNKSLTKEDMQKLPFSTRSTGDRMESDVLAKKKFSQSAAEGSLRQFRQSV